MFERGVGCRVLGVGSSLFVVVGCRLPAGFVSCRVVSCFVSVARATSLVCGYILGAANQRLHEPRTTSAEPLLEGYCLNGPCHSIVFVFWCIFRRTQFHLADPGEVAHHHLKQVRHASFAVAS